MSNEFADVLKAAAPAAEHAQKPSGRPRAKRTDPDRVQVTAYISRTTHAEVKLKLRRERLKKQGRGRDFSDLVQDLLADWVSR